MVVAIIGYIYLLKTKYRDKADLMINLLTMTQPP